MKFLTIYKEIIAPIMQKEGYVYKKGCFYKYHKEGLVIKKFALDVYSGQRCARILMNVAGLTENVFCYPEEKPKMLGIGDFGIGIPISWLAETNGYQRNEYEDDNMRTNENNEIETLDGIPIKTYMDWFPKYTERAFEIFMHEQKEILEKYCLPEIREITNIKELDEHRKRKLKDNPYDMNHLHTETSVYLYKMHLIDKDEMMARAENALQRAEANYGGKGERYQKYIDNMKNLKEKVENDDCQELYTIVDENLKLSMEACEIFLGKEFSI